jgi:Alpha/beta hydrolase domain
MPEIAAPLATYTGWNLRANGNGDGCDASGTKINFASTPATRAPGDPRKSILERYPTHQVYVNAVTQAVQKLQKDGFLIDEDAQAYIQAAQASTVPN